MDWGLGMDTPSSATFTNPVGGDEILIGDPFVLLHAGLYYLYGTTRGDGFRRFKCWVSSNCAEWTSIGYTLSLDAGSWSKGTFWAPEVARAGDRFFMVYSATNPEVKGYRICLAVADAPEGPFREHAAPLFDSGGSCWDGHIFIDKDDVPYLFYTGKGESYGVRLEDDFKGMRGEPVVCTEVDQEWEMPPEEPKFWCNEGPFVINHGGKYYMTYSGNHYASPRYAVGYATAPRPLGPWTKAAENPILKTDLDIPISGPGHNAFVASPDGKELFIVYHAHRNPSPPMGGRTVNIDRVRFDEQGRMLVEGPTRGPQPLPSGAQRTELPPHLHRRHLEFEERDRVRRTRDEIRRCLADFPPLVRGDACELPFPLRNHTDSPVVLEIKWGQAEWIDPQTVEAEIRAQQTASAVFTASVPQDVENAPTLSWKLTAGNATIGEGEEKLHVARSGLYAESEEQVEKLALLIDAPSQVVSGGQSWKSAEDCSARAFVNRLDEGIRVTVEVTDPQLWTRSENPHENDSVEIYFDVRPSPERGRTRGYTKGVFQSICVPGREEIVFFPENAGVPGATVVSQVSPSQGYRIEVFYPFTGFAENHFVPEGEFNFDVGINDAGGGKRRLQMMWSGTDRNWGDPRWFGRLRLTGEVTACES